MSFNTPFEFLIGIVDDIDVDANQAHVLDSYGRRHIVRLLPRRGGGPRPRVGESWIMDRSLGELAFHSVLIPNPPVISGEDGGNSGFRSLLSSLDEAGLIVNLVGEGDEFILPPGIIIPWGGSSAPTGFFICDGSAISRTTYADLFDEIGTTYGNGDGSTTFNIPDLRQRFPLGKAASGTGSTLGSSGGSINHTHTGPSHSHNVNPPNTNTSTPSNTQLRTHSTEPTAQTASSQHTHSVDIGNFSSGNAGTGNTGSNNPPYQVINYIISTVGLRGAPGPQGEQGEQGDQGPAGADGLDGDDGTVWFSGTGAPSGGLGVLGDFYLDTDSGDLYKKTGVSSWTLIDNLIGPQGDQGIQGETGPPGADGEDGEDGIVQSVVAGDNITVDSTDPANPVVSSTGGGSGDAGIEDILMLGGM